MSRATIKVGKRRIPVMDLRGSFPPIDEQPEVCVVPPEAPKYSPEREILVLTDAHEKEVSR
jgi:hypothetical protein